MLWDNKHSALLIICVFLGVWIAYLLQDTSGALGERDHIKEENEILYQKLNKLNNAMRAQEQEIYDKQRKIDKLELRKNEVAIKYRDRIVSVAAMPKDSVYSELVQRYLRNHP